MIALFAAALLAAAPAGELLAHVRYFVGSDGRAKQIVKYAEDEAGKTALRLSPGAAGPVKAALLREVTVNLASKRASKLTQNTKFPLSEDAIRRTIVDYEMFKAESFVRSGVFPKRYFGYFDGKWDTADYELKMRETVRGAVAIANAHQARLGSKVRITDIEIATTFLAEGGAILLREEQANLESIHPVFGVGLDDIGEGLEKHAPLVAALDKQFKTGLGTIAKRDGGEYRGATLTRNFTFVEAILGTVAMYVFEKELADGKMRKTEGKGIDSLPLDEQFIAGSLVYNSGILFAADRREMIRLFSSGPYLEGVSSSAKQRPKLPVANPKEALAAFVKTGYPEQPTSWAAVYHVLQRYGAYAGMRRFTDVFDEAGMYR